MRPWAESQRIVAEVDALFRRSADAHDELRASLARYVCVLASSYLEASLKELAFKYATRSSSPQVARYVGHALAGFRDPNCEKILQLVGRFDDSFRTALEDTLSDRLKASLESIYANRNSIAHGRRSGVSLAQAKAYYDDAQEVVARVERLLA